MNRRCARLLWGVVVVGLSTAVGTTGNTPAWSAAAVAPPPGEASIDPGSQVFDPVPSVRAEGRMTSGRLAQLPVGWYYETSVSSSTGVHVRTVCEEDEDDTALVVRGRGLVRFSDDSALAGGNGRGSYVRFDPPTPPLSERFTFTVFSMRRGTAYCSLDYSRNAGTTWTRLRTDAFGGTLIDVGPLRHGDTIEAQARFAGDGIGDASAHRTRLLLFSPTDQTRPALTAVNGGAGGNPRLTIPDDAWRAGKNVVLVGKLARSAASNTGVETRVDLLHGPLDTDYGQVPLGGWRWLDVGRYYGWVHVKTTAPVGHAAGHSNPADAMPSEPSCPSINRGHLDGWAFTMRVEQQRDGAAAAVATRRVRLAQMGAAPGEYNAFLLAFEVPEAGRYRMTTLADDPTVSFFASWRASRNPDASELTVASYNTLYDDGSNHFAKTRNASNLLATRGRIWREALEVEATSDQAPFQWEADVIGLQELRIGVSWPPAPLDPRWRTYVDLFRDEAERMGSRGWSYVWARDEEYTFGIDGLGPLFVASPFYPGPDGASIRFSPSALEAAGCATSEVDPTWVQCELDEEGPSPGRGFNATLVRMSVWRSGASSDRPLVVVNVHLRSGDAKFQDRLDQLDDLMGTLDTLLREDPRAFNTSGASEPQHHGNRIVVLGDFNMRSHHCGEHYWILRRLREHFGYALDAAMAVGDFDMHDERGSFANWVDFDDWEADPAGHPRYPWWLTTYRGKESAGNRRTERYDAIMLVGKGWAYDDPVVEYEVMNDRSRRTPMAPAGLAVEQGRASDLVDDGRDASGHARGYRPNYRLSTPTRPLDDEPSLPSGPDTLTPGEPALDSDHVPIRARLRVFQR